MLKQDQRSSPITHPFEAQHKGNAASQVELAECAGMQELVDPTSVGACLPGWLGRANMLLSLIAKLALC